MIDDSDGQSLVRYAQVGLSYQHGGGVGAWTAACRPPIGMREKAEREAWWGAEHEAHHPRCLLVLLQASGAAMVFNTSDNTLKVQRNITEHSVKKISIIVRA